MIENRSYIRLHVAMQSTHGFICLPDGSNVGLLNRDVFAALSDPENHDNLQVEIFISLEEWNAQTNIRKQPKNFVMKANVVLHGPRQLGDTLAKSLGLRHLFLQPPLDGMSFWPYHNPQSLSLSYQGNYIGDSASDMALRAALASRGVEYLEETVGAVEAADSQRLETLVENIETLFDQVTHSNSHRHLVALASHDQRMISSLFS